MYLIKNDYRKQIQDVNLNQVISDDDTILNASQLAAQEECIGYLVQRYEVDSEFTDTLPWSNTTTYKAGQRVYLDATTYSASLTYAVGALCLQAGKVYRCSTAVNTPEAFNAGKWTEIGSRYDIFYAKYPKTPFDLYGDYAKDDEVFYKDKTYTALKNTIVMPHDVALQYRSTDNLPLGNVFPDDAISGANYWGTGTPYSVSAGTLPTDATKWVKGDNRNQLMVMYMIDVTLFHVHSRLTPRNIPQLRIDRYTNAITWLTAAGRGAINARLPEKQPKAGGRIRYGGNIKNINSY